MLAYQCQEEIETSGEGAIVQDLQRREREKNTSK